MDYTDALRSGRRYRRPGMEWRNVRHDACVLCERQEDLVKDDWEVEDPDVRITRGQLLAVLAATKYTGAGGYKYYLANITIEEIAEKLGLGVPK